MAEEWGNQLLVYFYDDAGLPMGMMYRNSSYADKQFDYYLYEKDVFGNIIAIYNEAGTKVASYCYDAWGNCTVLTNVNGIGVMNPFRYRGYYLDTETNLYYLQTRYYDSYTGRFINADGQLNGAPLGYNLFAYCENNPVMYIDPDGEGLIALLVGVGVLVAVMILAPSDNDQTQHYTERAEQKYNENTIEVREGSINDSPSYHNGMLLITFDPDQHLIDIRNSYRISSVYEKKVIIKFIMNSKYYDPSVYGHSADDMLVEWSAHNLTYWVVTTFPCTIPIFVSRGYNHPVESTRNVDFRQNLSDDTRALYNRLTLNGRMPW